MPKSWAKDVSDDEDEEELLDYELESQKDAILLCIDASESMQRINPETGKSNFYMALHAAMTLQMRKLVSSPKDLVGVLLFNTEETKKEDHAGTKPHDYCLQPIKQVDVPRAYELKELINEADEDAEALSNKFPPHKGPVKITNVLATINFMMRALPKAGSKRVFFITDNDDPAHGHTKELKMAFHRVKDMTDSGVYVEPFFISSEEKRFDVNKFYAEVFGTFDDDAEDKPDNSRNLYDATKGFKELEQEMELREMPKRTVFKINFELGKDFVIGIRGYATVVEQKKDNPVKTVKDENGYSHEVTTRTQYECRDTGRVLDSQEEVQAAYQFGSDTSLRSKVIFSPAELRAFRTLGVNPGLKLLGFKDADQLKFEENVKHSYFLYPDEDAWNGSTRVFSALLNSMLSKKKIGYGLFMGRLNQQPSFVALLPQAEETSEDGAQLKPPGIHLIPLPFADDIRDPPIERSVSANDAEVDAAKAIIERFTKKQAFNPDRFPNPALRHHYEILKAVAFGDDLPQDPEDKTIPTYTQIKQRTGALISAWQDVIDSDERSSASAAPKTSRYKAAASGSNGNTRSEPDGTAKTSNKKAPLVMEDSLEENLKALHAKESLNKLKVDELKAGCDFYRLEKSGRKADLVARLGDHLDKLFGAP